MKRCPECRRDYYDESLLYCLDDGSALLEGPASGSEQPTALFVDQSGISEPLPDKTNDSRRRTVVVIGVGVLVALILGTGLLLRPRPAQRSLDPSAAGIRTLAVLPLRPLDSGDNYLGLGIADAMIRRISQTGDVTVRPLSAVRKYVNDDTDALVAAQQLNVEAVLEGSIQRTSDRIRASVNLLRVSDGTSIWSDNFDMPTADIFKIQDEVAQQVVSKLRLKLDTAQQELLTKRATSDPVAYEFYVKGIYSLDLLIANGFSEKDVAQAEATAELFKHAIAADPNYALAHAQLAIAYSHTAMFIQPNDPAWVSRTRQEIATAQSLDPELAETRIARSLLLWSSHEGWQTDDAIRELRAAQQINPNVGHDALALLYQHAGLEDLAAAEMQRALQIDPTSESVRRLFVDMADIVGKFDEGLAASQRFFGDNTPGPFYYIANQRLDEAQKAIQELSIKDPDNAYLPQERALLFASQKNFRAAEAEIPMILSKMPLNNPAYHHATFRIACIYALEGKQAEAIKWLKETATTGFPCYPLFARAHSLDGIRGDPAFIDFMTEQKSSYDRRAIEFGR